MIPLLPKNALSSGTITALAVCSPLAGGGPELAGNDQAQQVPDPHARAEVLAPRPARPCPRLLQTVAGGPICGVAAGQCGQRATPFQRPEPGVLGAWCRSHQPQRKLNGYITPRAFRQLPNRTWVWRGSLRGTRKTIFQVRSRRWFWV